MNTVHPTAIIGPQVELGENNTIGPYAVIVGPVTLGDGNWVGPHAVLGTPAEIRDIDHGVDPVGAGVGAGLRIGSRNVFREYTTIHQGHYAVTTVGDDCYVMNKVYVGHDGTIGDRVTMASSVTLGGHVSIGPGANLGMNAVVHQRRVIGPLAMVGMGSAVTRDVVPGALAYGNPCRVHGANRVGMARAGIDGGVAQQLHQLYGAAAPDPDAGPPLADQALGELWQWWDEHRR